MIDPNSPPPPRQLRLSPQFRPLGYYTNFKQWPIYPNSSNQYWAPLDVIRFYNTTDSGVMDPYRSSIDFTVQVNEIIQPVGLLQVDKSANSFFGQMVMSSKNIQVERITQYDVLAGILMDLGTSQVVSQGRSFQGMGFNNQQTQSNWMSSTSSNGQLAFSYGGTGWGQMMMIEQSTQNCISPTRTSSQTNRGNMMIAGNFNTSAITPYDVAGMTSANSSIANYLWTGPGIQWDSSSSITPQQTLAGIQAKQGRFNNIRAQYQTNLTLNNYPDSNNSNLQVNPVVQGQTWNAGTMTQNSNTSGFNPKAPYNIGIPSVSVSQFITPPNTVHGLTTPNIAPMYGYQKPTCPQTGKGGNQAVLSATVPFCQMNQGQITQNKFPVCQKKFSVPLFSGICGCLIPPDQFLLITMKSLKDLLVQLTLSPYGMFTSGYSDVHQFDAYGMGIQQKRIWSITSIYWNIHLYTFASSQINQKLNASLTKTIPITTNFYYLGNTFQLPSGQVVRNMWPISCQSESLSQIYCVFLSNEYQKYSFCRKQFRLSNNITSMQIRLKTDFYPTQPIVGNAGNPEYFNNQMDNSAFLKQLYLSNNYHFNLNVPMPKINKVNFAINGRCYNTSNTSTFYDPNMLLNPNYTWTSASVNYDTALGMSYFHQNRYVGMAVYSWTWEPYGHSTQYMNGINTAGNQNFAVQFTTSSTNYFPSDQTLIIFCKSNGIILYTDDGIKVVAK